MSEWKCGCGWTNGCNLDHCARCNRDIREAIGVMVDDEDLIADLRAALAAAEKERDHWKANHDNQVRIKRAIFDRPDLAERAKLVQTLIADAATLAEECRAWREWYRHLRMDLGDYVEFFDKTEVPIRLTAARAATDAAGALTIHTKETQ